MRKLLVVVVSLLSLLAGLGTRPAGADTLENIDLINDRGFMLWSMRDPQWGGLLVGPEQDDPGGKIPTKTFASCGCMVTALASILNYEFGTAWGTPVQFYPHFQAQLAGGQTKLQFNPPYVDQLLRTLHGYKNAKVAGDPSCGNVVQNNALVRSAWPPALRVDGELRLVGPTGITISGLQLANGLTWAERERIKDELRMGRPVIVARNKDGASHAQVIVGWNEQHDVFVIVDPITGSVDGSYLPIWDGRGTDRELYEQWEAHIGEVWTYRLAYDDASSLELTDDPSPVEILAVAPDGRRVGIDPATHEPIREIDDATVASSGSWDDPWGIVPAGDPWHRVGVLRPQAGTWRFQVTGTGSGRAVYDLTYRANDRTQALATVDEAIEAGDLQKWEVPVSAGGLTTEARRVASFTPEARFTASEAIRGRTVTFDASASFDLDGTIARYEWTFPGGASATGPVVTRSFWAVGPVAVELTVVDDTGQRATTSRQIVVGPTERIAPTLTLQADPPGSAWSSTPVSVTIAAADAGSGVASLRYRIDGAAARADAEVDGTSTTVVVDADGESTIVATAVDADGNTSTEALHVAVDRSAPEVTVGVPTAGAVLPAAPFAGGTVTDTSGVTSVEVAVTDRAAGAWWDGAGWNPNATWLPAVRHGAQWTFEVAADAPAFGDGAYELRVRASDRAGNSSEPTVVAVTVDRARRADAPIAALPTPDGTQYGRGLAINTAGEVVGHASNGPSDLTSSTIMTAARWTTGTFEELDRLAGFTAARAQDVNASGVAVGFSATALELDREATLWDAAGNPVSLGVLDAGTPSTSGSAAYAVNGDGAVAGYSDVPRAIGQVWNRRAVVWWRDARGTTVIQPGRTDVPRSVAHAISDNGTVVGVDEVEVAGVATPAPFLWTPSAGWQALPPLSPGKRAEAHDVNDEGLAVGLALSSSGGYLSSFTKAVVWQHGAIVDLGYGEALAVNRHGQVAGRFTIDGNHFRPGIWQDGQFTDLTTLVPPTTGWTISRVTDINDDGVVTGEGTFNGRSRPFVLDPHRAGQADVIAPVTEATAQPASPWATDDVTVTLQATDEGGSGVAAIWHDGTPGGRASGDTATVTVTDEGETVLRYFAVDGANNVEAPQLMTVRIDRSAPTVTASTPATTSGWHRADTAVTIEAADTGSGVASVTWSIGGGPTTTVTGGRAVVPVTAEGTTVVRVTATDLAGNRSAEQEVTVRIDRTAPRTEIVVPAGPVSPTTMALFTATDAGSGVAEVSAVDEAAGRSSSYELGQPLDEPGTHRIVVTAVDAAGNTGRAEAAVEVVVPPAPPADVDLGGNRRPVAVAGGPYEVEVGRTLSLDGSASYDPEGSPLAYRWSFDTGRVLTGATPSTSFTTPGLHLVTLEVNDGTDTSRATDDWRAYTVVRVTPRTTRDVRIDVKPGNDLDPINPGASGTVPVAILADGGFDPVLQLDWSTISFGRTGVEPSLDRRGNGDPNCVAVDVDRDGRRDLRCHFHVAAAGFVAGDTTAVLRAVTVDEVPVEGHDAIVTVPR